jgi:hypothetical protein
LKAQADNDYALEPIEIRKIKDKVFRSIFDTEEKHVQDKGLITSAKARG